MISRFAVTLFVSATLLFACQPMVARMIVPLLGGAPAVWILCSLCFQALVLGGYFYAHVVGSRFAIRTQVVLQIALIVSAFVVLPIVVDEALLQSLTARSRSLGLLVVLLRSVGLPFFVLSTTSPLLQRWYAELGETDPYHLYTASNAGSMVALLGYPFLVEPFLALKQQSRALSVAYVGYAALVIVCALTALRRRHPPRVSGTPAPAGVTMSEDVAIPPGPESCALLLEQPVASGAVPSIWRERSVWLLLAFVPSSLLLGATEFITTDVASVPLLWVVPLALYLASFIVAFAKRQVVAPAIASRALAILAALVGITKVTEVLGPSWVIVGLHLALLFVASVVCHRALALRRPHHTRLTEFYLVLSVGGVLGGAFNGLVAPVVFDDLLEYPIAIALCLLARVAIEKSSGLARTWGRDVGAGLALTLLTFGLVRLGEVRVWDPKVSVFWMYVLPVLSAFAWSRRPVRYGVALGGILLVSATHGGLTGNTIHKERGFFGSLKVRQDPSARFVLLVSGSTLHGAQSIDPKLKHVPLTYYFPTGPAGDVLGPWAERSDESSPSRRVGVIGLGVGSLAAYARPRETWTFFELNPRVITIAKMYFSYLADVPPSTQVLVEDGDARLRLRDGGEARFDILVLDAFSSDAIPVHLMTREAVAIYRRTLRPGGILLAHVSNRHVLLEPILAALAADAGLLAIGRDEGDVDARETVAQKAASHWVCVSESAAALDAIAAKNAQWRRLPAPRGEQVWTDDFANVLAAMHF